jgi:hypothetical protein
MTHYSLGSCIKNVTFLRTSSKLIHFESVGRRDSLGDAWDVALPGKNKSFFFSRGGMLGAMLSQKQSHKSYQGSCKPFVSNAKVEGKEKP